MLERTTPKKSLGQHWLVDQGVLRAILDAAEPLRGSQVVEVGPGRGALTRGLLERGARVVAVEKDEALAAELGRELAAEDFQLIRGDILQVNLREYLGGPYQVVANIPYYLSGRLFRLFYEEAPRPERLTLLIQREVADRITAAPGEMNLLALATGLHGSAQILRTVPPEAFRPPPKVDSALIQIELNPTPHPQAAEVLRLARLSFAGRRKQLKSSLAAGLGQSSEEVSRLIESAGIDPRTRPQDLSLGEWERLSELVNHG